jgi:hypothetical protein
MVVVAIVVARLVNRYLDGPSKARASRPAESADATLSSVVPDLDRWAGTGIDEAQAQVWMDNEFDVDGAAYFRSLVPGIDAVAAARLRSSGLEQWVRLGLPTRQALDYATAGFTVTIAEAWRDAGWDDGEAFAWFSARFDPTPAAAWRASEFAPREAQAWKREHFGVRQAHEWRRLGDTPEQARDVERRLGDAGITVTDGLRWLDRGFSLEEICAGWPSLATGSDAGSWRTEWRGMSLSPIEVSDWHVRFSHDEATRWIHAGVRDPAIASRLHRRGVEPDDVVRVLAERFNDLFQRVPVTRDDLLSAAGQIARAGGSPDIRHRLERAAARGGRHAPTDVDADLIEAVLDELQRLERADALGAPHTARALARRLQRGLIAATLVTGRDETAPDGSVERASAVW